MSGRRLQTESKTETAVRMSETYDVVTKPKLIDKALHFIFIIVSCQKRVPLTHKLFSRMTLVVRLAGLGTVVL